MKFCGKCGTFNRADVLKLHHFPYCQPKLEVWNSGYLENSELPETNVEDFRMMLRIMGVSEKPQKPRKRLPTPAPAQDTGSEEEADSVSRFSGKQVQPEEPESDASFGLASHVSSANNFCISLSPIKKSESSDEDKPEPMNSSPVHNLPK